MDRHRINIKQKDDYIEQLEAKMYPRGHLLNGQIDLTYRCNLKCQHCFIAQEEGREELKFDEIIGIIDEIYNAGCLWLCFSGGEAFFREDFLDIYTYARNKGLLVSIFTSGTLITRKIADYLAKNPPYSIEITLNGITKEVYEEVTQVSGSFIMAMKAIQLLKERSLPLVLKCNGMKINKNEILKIKKFSENLLGKKRFRCDLVLCAGMDGSKEPCNLRLAPDEILSIQYSDEDMFSLCKDEFFSHSENARIKGGYLFPCGLTSFQIDPYGRMRLCSFLREDYVDLKQEGFIDGFRTLYSKFSSFKFKTNPKCRSCGISHLCRQCPGRAFTENGDIEAPVDYFCQLAHRTEERGTMG